MSKDITKYRGYTADYVKTRAEVPDQGDMTVSGNDVQCVNLTMTKLKNGVGGSSYKLSELCKHANRNQWSGFGTKVRSVAAQALVNSDPTENYKFGDHAGYNHGAVTPGWKSGHPATADIWVNNGDDAEFLVDIVVGEVKWHEVANGIVGVVFALYDGATIVGYVARNFNDASVTDDVTGLYAYIQANMEKTYTGKIWLVDSTDFGPEGFDDSQIVCRLPNTSDFTRTVKIKYMSSWVFSDTGNMNLPSPWVQNQSHAMNWTNGVFNIGSIARLTECNVRIYVRLFNWLDQLVASGYIVGDANNYYEYDPMDGIDITGTVDLGEDLIWGYKVYVDFEYYT